MHPIFISNINPRAGKVLIAMTVFIFLSACKGKESADKTASEKTVTVITVTKKDVPAVFEYVAVTESSRLVNIQARVNGFLDQRVYTEGSIVNEGDVLFIMDKKPFQAQVDAAKAALARQKAAMETAKLNLDRTIPLTKLNALSQKDLDDATGRYESSYAAVDQAKAELETAELNLSYCTITSPLHGISSNALQQDGAYLNVQNSQLTTVAALDPIWVNFSLSENQMLAYLNQVKNKELVPPKDEAYKVDVILVDGSTFPHAGRITFTQPSYNSETGTFLIRASLENPQGILRPNQHVHVKVRGAVRPNTILVPQKAVGQSSKGHYVWIVDAEGALEFRPVIVGLWQDSDWIIREGLKPGERVVVDGGQNVRAGEKVQSKQQED